MAVVRVDENDPSPDDPLSSLAADWRSEAETFRAYDADRLAAACDRHADQLEAAHRAYLNEPLPLGAAHRESGYSVDHLRRLVGDKIPDAGDGDTIMIRRGDLPLKPGQPRSGGRSPNGTAGSRSRVARTVLDSEREEEDGKR